MTSNMKCLVSLVIGAVVGGGIVYFTDKDRYEKKLKEQVDSVRKTYDRYSSSLATENPTSGKKLAEEVKEFYVSNSPVEKHDDLGSQNYDSVVAQASTNQNKDYTAYFDTEKTPYEEADYETIKMIENDTHPSEPHVLTTEEFYDEDDDETVVKLILHLYDDGTLTDDMEEPIEDVSKVVNQDDLDRFIADENESDLFVKVDSRQCIYCIEKQGETWEEMLERHPYRKEV